MPSVPVVAGDRVDERECRQAPDCTLHRRNGRTRAELLQRSGARYGYEAEAERTIQDLYLDGNKRAEAAAAVPDSLVDEVGL